MSHATDGSDASQYFENWPRYRVFLFGRVGVFMATLSAIAIASLLGGASWRALLVVGPILTVIVLTVPYYYWGRNHTDSLRSAYAAILAIDILLTTVGSYTIGGENAVYGLTIFGIYVAMAGTVLPARDTIWVAVGAATCFGAMTLATGFGLLPEQSGIFSFRYSDAWYWMLPIVNSAAVAIIAMIAVAQNRVASTAIERSRRFEGELRALNRNLEDRIEDALAALRDANRSLESKNQALERTMHQVNLFAKAVSHDLRKPIAGAAEAVRMAATADSPRRELLEKLAFDNLLRADRMLDGLRDLIKATGSRPAPQWFDLRPLVEDVRAGIQNAMGGQRLPVGLVGEWGPIFGSPVEVGHIFRNLIANAIEHNPEREDLLVEVGMESDGDRAVFFVRDNGVGIHPRAQKTIFEPFRHIGPSGGYGLGLALVQALVENHGGEIRVTSASGEGSEFRFWLSTRNAPA